MADFAVEEMRCAALTRDESDSSRLAAIRNLGQLRDRLAVDTLLEVATRQDEPLVILHAAGLALANLQAAGVSVTEWDLRDLARPAAESFFA